MQNAAQKPNDIDEEGSKSSGQMAPVNPEHQNLFFPNFVTTNDFSKEQTMRRGRGRPRVHESNAARVKAHREKHQLVSFTVELPKELADGLEEYIKYRDTSKAAVIAKLIKTQLLRKR